MAITELLTMLWKEVQKIVDLDFTNEIIDEKSLIISQVYTLTSGGIKEEGAEYPLLFKTDVDALHAFIMQLIFRMNSYSRPIIYWRTTPKLIELEGKYTISSRVYISDGYRNG